MDRNKKTLLAEIRSLLRGPVPERSIVCFEGEYHLSETLKGNQTTKILTHDQAKAILNEDPDCRVSFVYLTHQDLPAHLTDDNKKYEWIREHQIEPEIPDIIQSRINPPEGIIIGVTSRKCAESLVRLFQGIPENRVAPEGNLYL